MENKKIIEDQYLKMGYIVRKAEKRNALKYISDFLKKRIINLLLKKGYKGNFIIPLPNIKILEGKKLL